MQNEFQSALESMGEEVLNEFCQYLHLPDNELRAKFKKFYESENFCKLDDRVQENIKTIMYKHDTTRLPDADANVIDYKICNGQVIPDTLLNNF